MIAIVEMEKYIEWSVLRGIGKNLNPFPLYAIVRYAPLQTRKVATSDVLIVGRLDNSSINVFDPTQNKSLGFLAKKGRRGWCMAD